MTELIAQLDRLTNARSVEELWDVHTKQMSQYGFDRLMYGFTRYRTSSSLGDPQDWVLLSTQSQEYMKVFFDEGLYFHAPMLNWALANDGACSWRWMMDMNRIDNLTQSEKRVMDFNREMDVTAGYTISFRSISERTKGAIALTARAGLSQDQVEQTWAKHGDAIIVMNNVMHLKLLTLPYSGERHLTKRQREVLQWVGDGKTTQDIAVLLELTPATVEKHLRLAREALDVETTAQAVLKAAFYNQMFVMDSAL
ncbi:LuxR family transcriptional regulator [Cognatiyoonia sp. IB215182]|uniref:LuxR family transcriptional regulator n=1 Tax=Cognatiyoonia sp. IB215182 TaxID=3097353 RepID=UPI002A10583B|nr:LuxR family transcriptional regulator [Cognatiyoonia sp. IB215182]MDX8353649.1 LuxR family transcriptional regulator [Cognatiyoonia sp. IB215182]